MKYVARIEEILKRHIIVEAESEEEAQEKAESFYQNGKVELDYGDYSSGEILITKEATEKDERLFELID